MTSGNGWLRVVAWYIPLHDPDDVERLRRVVDGIREAKARERVVHQFDGDEDGVAHCKHDRPHARKTRRFIKRWITA